jgi:hypothetical protein
LLSLIASIVVIGGAALAASPTAAESTGSEPTTHGLASWSVVPGDPVATTVASSGARRWSPPSVETRRALLLDFFGFVVGFFGLAIASPGRRRVSDADEGAAGPCLADATDPARAPPAVATALLLS